MLFVLFVDLNSKAEVCAQLKVLYLSSITLHLNLSLLKITAKILWFMSVIWVMLRMALLHYH